MLTTQHVDDVIHRTGAFALVFYPEVVVDNPTFDISGDVRWILEEVPELPEQDRAVLENLVGRTIVDPSKHRNELSDFLADLVSSVAEG